VDTAVRTDILDHREQHGRREPCESCEPNGEPRGVSSEHGPSLPRCRATDRDESEEDNGDAHDSARTKHAEKTERRQTRYDGECLRRDDERGSPLAADVRGAVSGKDQLHDVVDGERHEHEQIHHRDEVLVELRQILANELQSQDR